MQGNVSREGEVNRDMERGSLSLWAGYTDKKENKIFLIFKEIQRDRAQSLIWLTAILHMVKKLHISSYIRNPFLLFMTLPIPSEFSAYMRKIFFSFLSVWGGTKLRGGQWYARLYRASLKMLKIFDRSDFPDFYTIKSSWVGDLVVKIKKKFSQHFRVHLGVQSSLCVCSVYL